MGGVHRKLHVLNLIWFGNIARLSQWEGGGNFLVHMIFTCRRYVQRKGGGSAPCDLDTTLSNWICIIYQILELMDQNAG